MTRTYLPLTVYRDGKPIHSRMLPDPRFGVMKAFMEISDGGPCELRFPPEDGSPLAYAVVTRYEDGRVGKPWSVRLDHAAAQRIADRQNCDTADHGWHSFIIPLAAVDVAATHETAKVEGGVA